MNRYRKLTQTVFHRFNIGLALAAMTLALLVAKPLWRAWAAAGDLDTTFSGDGRKEDFPFSNITILTKRPIRPRTAIQADGKSLVLIGEEFTSSTGHPCYGIGNFELVRLNQNGNLDTGFGSNGKVTTSFGGCEKAADLAIQSDGKIIVVGGTGDLVNGGKLILARYHPNGSLDTSFDGDGKVYGNSYTTALKVALQDNGDILIYGLYLYPGPPARILLRLNSNGSVDTTFGNGSPAAGYFRFLSSCLPFTGPVFYGYENYSLRIQNDGKILVSEMDLSSSSGSGSCMQRMTSNGQPDTSFGVSGAVQITQFHATDLKLQDNNKLIFLGYEGMRRYNADGSPDLEFGLNGVVTNPQPDTNNYALAIQEDGRLLVAGRMFFLNRQRAVVSRFLSDGTLDTSFGTGGIRREAFPNLPNLDQNFGDVSLHADGRIIATGIHNYTAENKTAVMARYKNDNTDTQTTDVGLGTITAVSIPFSNNSWTFTIPVTNYSSVKAAHVTVNANVPTGSSFQAIAPPAGWAALQLPSVGATSGIISCSTYSLAPGAIANVTISVKIPANTPPGTAIAMLANVTTTTADPNNSNNSASKLFYWQ